MATNGKEKMTERGDNRSTAGGKRSGASASYAVDNKAAPAASLRKLNNADDTVLAEISGLSSDSELSSFATSSVYSFRQQHNEHWFQMVPGSQRAQPLVNSSSSNDGDGSECGDCSECGDSTCCSMPESEAFWSDLPSMKPLINPSRLQALRLCSRDCRIPDSDSSTMRANPTSPEFDDQKLQRKLKQRQETLTETLANSSHNHQTLANNSHNHQTLANSSHNHQTLANSSHNHQTLGSRSGNSQDETNAADSSTHEELDLAESASYPREAIYQYSFRVPETKANMRPFSDPADRRVEAIARACDSEILLDPQPIYPIATSAIRLRRVTIRAPDKHNLEKCCRMFDDKFPHFYVSGGLGPGDRGISKVFDNAEEKCIPESHYRWK